MPPAAHRKMSDPNIGTRSGSDIDLTNHPSIDVWDGTFARLVPLLDRTDVLCDRERRDIVSARAGAVRDARALSRIALRLALGRTLGVAAADLPLRRGAHGKPVLPGGPSFNVSHTDAHLVIAIAKDQSIGVDVERLRPMTDWKSVAAIAFTDRERDTLAMTAAGAGDQRDRLKAMDDVSRALLAGWTRKEALLKGVGLGVTRHLLDVEVRLGAFCNDALVRASLPGTSARDWRVLAFDNLPDLVGAIAIRSRVPPILCSRSLDELLQPTAMER